MHVTGNISQKCLRWGLSELRLELAGSDLAGCHDSHSDFAVAPTRRSGYLALIGTTIPSVFAAAAAAAAAAVGVSVILQLLLRICRTL